MNNGPTREAAARQLAQIVGEFVRAHGHNMPDAEIQRLAESISTGSLMTYYTPQSSTLSYVEYDPDPFGPDFRPIYCFSRDHTGHTYEAALDALLPAEQLNVILNPIIPTMRTAMHALSIWYREFSRGPLPNPVLTNLPEAIVTGRPYGWEEHGFFYHIGPSDVNGYILRIMERETRHSKELDSYPVQVICRELSLKATARLVELIGKNPLPYYVVPIDPSNATDLAELIGVIIKWWFPQEFTLAKYPGDAQHNQFVETIRQGKQAILMIPADYAVNHRIVIGLPDDHGNIVRLEASYGVGQWKPVLYGTECINLALEQTLGRETLLGLFTQA